MAGLKSIERGFAGSGTGQGLSKLARNVRLSDVRRQATFRAQRSQKCLNQRLQIIAQAVALTEQVALIESYALRVKLVARQLATLGRVLKEYDHRIAHLPRSSRSGDLSPVFLALERFWRRAC